MAQLQAGYFLESIKKLFSNQSVKYKFDALMKQLSFFDFQAADDLQNSKSIDDSVVKVANNIITRGLPTRPSTFIEDILSTTFSHIEKEITEHGEISYSFKNEDLKENIYRALHVIDPRITKENQKTSEQISWTGGLDGYKEDFLFMYVPEFMGQHFIQLIEQDRDFESILHHPSQKEDLSRFLTNEKYAFTHKTIDFVLETPYLHNEKKGIALEIDDRQYEQLSDIEINKAKNEVFAKIKWADKVMLETSKLTQLSTIMKPFMEFTYNEYFDMLTKNFRSPLYRKQDGLDALQLALTPIAIARIQSIIIKYILAGKLALTDEKWDIAIIERDVPAAFLAIRDLKNLFQHLFALEGKGRNLPSINLSLYKTTEFDKAKLNILYQGEKKLLEEFDTQATYDLLIDLSVLQRENLINPIIDTVAKNFAIIRSVRSCRTERSFSFGSPIAYDLSATNEEPASEAIDYFLRTIFRKSELLPGQAQLIHKMLSQQNALGYLPTGGGKTLVYQLCTLLQPGITLAVHPLRSLMKDQYKQLQSHGIDAWVYLNIGLKKQYEKQKAKERFEQQKTLFAFISPERLQIHDFREQISRMNKHNIPFMHLVIDEIHAVSEWSHDFRPVYVGMAHTARQLCSNSKLTILGLTATASYDVVEDIKYELALENNNIVRQATETPKLAFEIIHTECSSVKKDSPYFQAKKTVAMRKQVHLTVLLTKLLENNNKLSHTLIYSPETLGITGISTNTNDGIADKITTGFPDITVGSFYGSTDDWTNPVAGDLSDISEQNYTDFIQNKSDVLVATKSFGIGVNKRNLKNIIYFNMPDSVEGFIQQVNRTGRKNGTTDCFILFNNSPFDIDDEQEVWQNGEFETIVNQVSTTVDKQIQRNEFERKYRGRRREKNVIDEFLSAIEAPNESPDEVIYDLVWREFNRVIDFDYQPKYDPIRLYINSNFKSFGYIDFRTNSIHTESSAYDNETSKQLLHFVLLEIEKRVGNDVNKFEWLRTKVTLQQNDGIEQILKNLKLGETSRFSIHFRNNTIGKITDLLNLHTSKSFTEKQVLELSRKNTEAIDFLSELADLARINIVNKEINLREEIHQLYFHVRNLHDTQLALFRMLMIGVIDDYVVDFKYNTIEIVLTKKTDLEYIKTFENYLLRFVSENRVRDLIETTQKDSNSLVRNLLYAAIDYTYQDIVPKHYLAIDEMEALCHATMSEGMDSEQRNQKINQYLASFFDTKYTNSLIKPNLLDRIESESDDLVVIKEFIARIGNLKNNWQHLHASTAKLLETNSHLVFRFLHAYTKILLNNTDNDNEINQLIEYLNEYKTLKKLDTQTYKDVESDIMNSIYQQSDSIKSKIEPIFLLKTHNSWLSKFNQQFLAGYGQ